ncbi:TrmH family RNA methyltransferase [Parapedobacter soli]|uniref:TrmH family RNA methyltransferase n=1 Tax=Parapedobacter soli TaxID=416955 RepID=UPI0021C7203C|nr:RNA methyltransferase [Parapedobacter soli]
MLSKPQIRAITSLQQKKFRREHGLFIVEGIKSVTEFLHSDYRVQCIYHTAQAAAKLPKIPQNIKSVEIDDQTLKRISSLKTPQGVLALVSIPDYAPLTDNILRSGFHLVLDDIQDPGNLGTIIRTADWFGFKRVICSVGSVDAYNVKTVQASMGSLSRIQVHYTAVAELVTRSPVPVFGAVLNGSSIYDTDFGKHGLVVLGNEGNGIGAAVLPYITRGVTIPRIGGAESLNVAISAALFCAELTRTKGG